MKSNLFRVSLLCNQNCFFCNIKNKQFEIMRINKKDEVDLQEISSKFLNFEVIKKNLDETLDNGCKEIFFTGGEPTIINYLVDLVSIAHLKGVEVGVQSNGIRFSYLTYTKTLVSAGLSNAFISLHSHIEEISDFLTRSPGTYKKTILGIHNLLNCGVEVDINIVINSINYRFLP
ncbi:MAG: radical SAM protein, partial [Candidatus Diapherotrites archaeon]|nr:radical SAM protein [Candidatus Diapherotrites archaeon]